MFVFRFVVLNSELIACINNLDEENWNWFSSITQSEMTFCFCMILTWDKLQNLCIPPD